MSDRTLPIHFDTSYAWMRVLISKSHWLNDAEFQSLPAFPPVLFSQKKNKTRDSTGKFSTKPTTTIPATSRYLQKVINWVCQTSRLSMVQWLWISPRWRDDGLMAKLYPRLQVVFFCFLKLFFPRNIWIPKKGCRPQLGVLHILVGNFRVLCFF